MTATYILIALAVCIMLYDIATDNTNKDPFNDDRHGKS